MKLRNKIQIGAFVAFVVVALVFLIYGIVTHTEPGLKEGVPQWERGDFPLGIAAQGYTAEGNGSLDGDRFEVLENVIGTANTRLGFDAFELVEDGPVEVTLVVGVPFDEAWEDPGGHSQIQHTGGRAELCELMTSNTGVLEILWLVLYHELGHCLGLDHDDFSLSIMFPTTTPREGIPPWITDSDRDLLRDLYVAP